MAETTDGDATFSVDEALFYNLIDDNSWATGDRLLAEIDGYEQPKIVPTAITNITISDATILDADGLTSDVIPDGETVPNTRAWSSYNELVKEGWIEIVKYNGKQLLLVTAAGDAKGVLLLADFATANP